MSGQEQGIETYSPFDKAQTVDPEVRAYVYSLVTALGGTGVDEFGNYVLGDDAPACLRDLKLWLKKYDEKTNRLDVARCLAEANLVNGDLLPILATWEEGAENGRSKMRLALACLELLVPLTWPLEHGGEMTVNHHRHTPYIQQAQVRYKAGVLGYDRANILRTIVRIGLPSIATSRDDRTSRDEAIIRLMLYFFRNITIIAPLANLPSQELSNDVSRSATIEAFRQQDVFALILTMCSNMGEDFNLQDVILLEIIFNLIKGIDVEKLFMNEEQRKGQKTIELKDVLGKEKGMHRDYAKTAPTRHGRFGTMIWVKREDDKLSAVSGQDNLKDSRNSLFKMDKSKKWSKPQHRRKDVEHSIHDFDRTVRLNEVASELLRNFVEEFLDSGFNPLFTHLRKAIEREADRLTDVNYRQFFYTVSWFLQAERCRRARQEKDRKDQKVQTDFEAESYSLVASVLNQETFIILNRYMQTSLDNKEWPDLNASMRCFTQILLTVQEMAQSTLEDDQEIADNIQNRIFYEETTHDRILTILRSYKDQGFGYLDACTELSHVFLRMLERYSKQNTDLQIRSRRRARRKKKQDQKKPHPVTITTNATNSNNNNGEEEAATDNDPNPDFSSSEEDANEPSTQNLSQERKFSFTRLAAKFSTQPTVNTFTSFLTFYRDLTPTQLKRAHRFFHRVAFKQDRVVLLFRVDMVALFYRLIKGPEGLDRSRAGVEVVQEWEELVRQVLKRLFRMLEQRPELLVEMLFSKIAGTVHYLEHGYEAKVQRGGAGGRGLAEWEVKPAPGRGADEQIGIVVTTMVREGEGEKMLVRWVLEVVGKAAEERGAWEAEAVARGENARADAAPLDGGERGGEGEVEAIATEQATSKDAAQAPTIVLSSSSNEVCTATAKNPRLRLLLSLCSFAPPNLQDKQDAPWTIPSSLTATKLQHLHTTIDQYLTHPWVDDNGEREPGELLRRVKQPTTAYAHHVEGGDGQGEPRRDAFIDDSEGSDGLEEDFLFPDNARRAKTGDDDNDETASTTKNKTTKKRSLIRKRDQDTQAVDEERRKARERAALDRRRKIKSELYIHDSDEEMDDDENRAFFAREEENRRRQAERVLKALSLGKVEREGVGEGEWGRAGRKRKSDSRGGERGQGKKRRGESDGSDHETSGEEEDKDMTGIEELGSSPRLAATSDGDDDLEMDDTPLSSQGQVPVSDPQSGGDKAPLQEIPQPRLSIHSAAIKGHNQDEAQGEDELPVVVTQRRRVRAGFVLDDSDDE